VTETHLALALPSLPDLGHDGAMMATGVLSLLTLVIGLRAFLALGLLRGQARAANQLAERLDSELPNLEGRIAATRSQLRQLNASTEHALWALPKVDQRLGVAARQLGNLRIELDAWRGPAGERIGRTFSGIRGTLRVLNMAIRFGRVIQQ
jgi:hypothetical protein